MKSKRYSFIDTAIETAKAWSLRSEDPYKKVGACILNEEGRVLSIGYNGLLPKQKILKRFWLDRNERRKYMIHAETNALACISRYDKPYIIACTLRPCSNCAINICSHGIKTVIYLEDYLGDQESAKIFNFFKVKLIKYEN